MKKLLMLLTLTMMFGQADVSQRTIDVTIEAYTTITLNELFPQYDLDWALINIVHCSNDECVLYGAGNESIHIMHIRNGDSIYPSAQQNVSSFFTNSDTQFEVGSNINGEVTMKLLVTAEFPQEDTGYIEDGFDYCVEPGANLMSYPCDSAVALLDAIPSDALSQFEGIIGAGEAATNLNGTWVGSITNLTPGAGYWIKSNTALCFNYDCSEN
jgi:hypothetical protein